MIGRFREQEGKLAAMHHLGKVLVAQVFQVLMQQGGKLLAPQRLPPAKGSDELPQRSRTQALAGPGQAGGQLGWQVRQSALTT